MKAALSSLKDHKHALFVATALANTTIPRKSYDHQETQLVGAVKAKNLQELLQKEVEAFEERPQKEPQDQSFEQLWAHCYALLLIKTLNIKVVFFPTFYLGQLHLSTKTTWVGLIFNSKYNRKFAPTFNFHAYLNNYIQLNIYI